MVVEFRSLAGRKDSRIAPEARRPGVGIDEGMAESFRGDSAQRGPATGRRADKRGRIRSTGERSGRQLLWCVAWTAALGCGDSESFDGRLSWLPPVQVQGDVVFAETDRPLVHRVAVGLEEMRVTTTRLEGVPTALQVRAGDSHELLIVTRQERSGEGIERLEDTGSLVALGADESRRIYELGTHFNRTVQSKDGRFVFLYDTSGDASVGLGVLFNPNEVAIVDLAQPAGESNPHVRTLRSFGGRPRGVQLSPSMTLGEGEAKRLAVVLSDAEVTLIDLDHLGRREVTVRLTLADDPRPIRPAEVLFDPERAQMFIRAEASTDLFVIQLVPAVPSDPGANDFRPLLSQVPAGGRASQVALYDAGEGPRLLVALPERQELAVVEPASGRVSGFSVGFPASQITIFESVPPGANEPHPQALVLPATGMQAHVAFVELELLEERGSRNLELLPLGGSMGARLFVPDKNRVVLVQGERGFPVASLTVVDLATRTASPIAGALSLETTALSADGSTLWAAAAEQRRLSRLDLDSLRPTTFELEDPIARLWLAPVEGEGEVLIALHASTFAGGLTVVKADDPTQVRTFSGFLLEGLLQ